MLPRASMPMGVTARVGNEAHAWTTKIIWKIRASKDLCGKLTGCVATAEKSEVHSMALVTHESDRMKSVNSSHHRIAECDNSQTQDDDSPFPGCRAWIDCGRRRMRHMTRCDSRTPRCRQNSICQPSRTPHFFFNCGPSSDWNTGRSSRASVR